MPAQGRAALTAMERLRWGVLGVAGIAVNKVIPALQRGRFCHVAAIASRDGAPGARAYEALVAAFNAGLLIRITGDTIALSPPFIVERKDVDRIFETLAAIIDRLD